MMNQSHRLAHKKSRQIQSRIYCRRKGFTLIELVMAIIVSSIIVIPLAALITQYMTSTTASGSSTLAVNLARFEMERVKNIDFANINTYSEANYRGYPYDLTRNVDYVPPSDPFSIESLKEIRVEIRAAGSSDVIASLVTYLANNVNYGI